MNGGSSKSKVWIAPGLVWQLVFLLIPFVLILGVSFLSRGTYGEIERPWTLENYRRLLGDGELGFDPLYLLILGRTVAIAVTTALLCCLVSIPFCFYLKGLSGGWKLLAFTALLVPVWTNLLIRTYAWQTLLAPQGIISSGLAAIHIIAPGSALYPGWGAVLICLICDYLPFAALPIFASVEKMDRSILDAALDLGANRWESFRHAVWPQIRPGVLTGFVFVMLPSIGQFIVPDLLGGAKTVLIGNLLQQQFGVSRDWPFGASITSVTLLVVLAAITFWVKAGPEEEK